VSTNTSFWHLTEASASSYLGHIARREQARLGDFARLVEATGGPLEELDGSQASLIPLWTWLIDVVKAGSLPTVPVDAVSSVARFLGWTVDENSRLRYAFEPISHYVYAVVRDEDPGARWGFGPGITERESNFQEPVIVTSGRTFINAEMIGYSAPPRILDGPDSLREPTALLRVVESALGGAPGPSTERPSFLSPYLAVSIALDDPVRNPPIARFRPDEKGGGGMASESLVIAPIGPLDDPAAIPTMDEQALADGLTAMGWRKDDKPIRADDLRDETSQLIYGDDVALLEPVVFGDRLRFLNFDTINATDADWELLESGLHNLARSVDATFRPANAG